MYRVVVLLRPALPVAEAHVKPVNPRLALVLELLLRTEAVRL